MKMQKLILSLILVVFTSPLFAQFEISAELRARPELNNGLMTLPTENSETALFVSQRSRLNFSFKNEHFNTYFSIQDVRFWGENDIATKTGIQTSTKGFGVSQAWFDWKFAENWGLKTGRQIWNYDDGRILSHRNWNQYALAYDAFLLHLDKEKFQFHLGSSINNTWIGFNKTNFDPEGNSFEEPLGYRIKYFNFLWMKFKISDHFSLSFAEYFANYLAEGTKSTLYSLSTTALHADYHSKKLRILANVFYQYGSKYSSGGENSYMATISGNYKINAVALGLGLDYMSGAENNTGSFDLMYGARFKYNGWMNYYVIPGSTKNGGLIDLSPSINWSITKKHSVYAAFHQFWLDKAVYENIVTSYSNLNKNLGNEIDFKYTYKFNKSFNIQAYFGYYFATETTEYMKGIEAGKSTSPYWASVMLTFKPSLFKK